MRSIPMSRKSTRRMIQKLFLALLLIPAGALAQIHDSAEQVRPVLPGMSAPAVEFLDVEGQPVVLDPEALDKPLVLTFYRGGWCPYCNLHLAELRTVEAELVELGFDVWFASPDQPELLAEGDQAELGYKLLSDSTLAAAQAFGIAFRVDPVLIQRMAQGGMDLNARSGQDHGALPAPATFIIGSDGVIQFAYVNPDYSVRLAASVLQAAAQAYVDDQHKRFKRGSGG